MHAGTRISISCPQYIAWVVATGQLFLLHCPLAGTLVQPTDSDTMIWEIVLDDWKTIFVPEKQFTVTKSIDLPIAEDTL